ncbi:MAG: tRNA 2-thiouridine(34) synthase MnmA [Syntrophales bacterium]|nr:tRNA 2-thiouridine(34) synthase MnmA [Syntrophales bacterium]
MAKVLVAMSGGIDSSVSAWLLKEQGHLVSGLTMRLKRREGAGGSESCSPDAAAEAKSVAERLDIPHRTLDLSEKFEDAVVRPFLDAYARGRTPNPCMECNRVLKFGVLLSAAGEMGFDFLATGHYARLESNGTGTVLKKAKDRNKDQSYFLGMVALKDLSGCLFPLGAYTKEEVYGISRRAGLAAGGKKESQDLCFIAGRDYRSFLAGRIAMEPGPIVHRDGRILGRHKGIANYTVGQRSRLGRGGGEPLYVTFIDVNKNRIVVAERASLRSGGLIACGLNLLAAEWPSRASVKIRYRKADIPCRIHSEGEKLRVEFEEEQEGVTPGQAAVFYAGETVVGGGIIEGTL